MISSLRCRYASSSSSLAVFCRFHFAAEVYHCQGKGCEMICYWGEIRFSLWNTMRCQDWCSNFMKCILWMGETFFQEKHFFALGNQQQQCFCQIAAASTENRKKHWSERKTLFFHGDCGSLCIIIPAHISKAAQGQLQIKLISIKLFPIMQAARRRQAFKRPCCIPYLTDK